LVQDQKLPYFISKPSYSLMKYKLILFFLLFWCTILWSQSIDPASLGFRHFQMPYQGMIVEILVKSKKGEELISKPLFFFSQGSLPKPLIITEGKDVYGVFPFNTDSLLETFHLVIVGKPGVPLMAERKDLNEQYLFLDANATMPPTYIQHNVLDFYVTRNIAILEWFRKQSWVNKSRLVIAGHSEGSTIVAKMAVQYPKITDLIYAGGTPMGRIMSMIAEERYLETDTNQLAKHSFNYWQDALKHPNNMDATKGDTDSATIGFSYPPIHYLEKLNIPVLVSYGTKDWATPYIDYLQIETLGQKKSNFHFDAYVGKEHNFFAIKKDGNIDYDQYNWDKVALDWLRWLNKNKKATH